MIFYYREQFLQTSNLRQWKYNYDVPVAEFSSIANWSSTSSLQWTWIYCWLHLIPAATSKAALHAKYPWTFLAFDHPGEQTMSNNWLSPHGQTMGDLQNFPIFVSDMILFCISRHCKWFVRAIPGTKFLLVWMLFRCALVCFINYSNSFTNSNTFFQYCKRVICGWDSVSVAW